MNQTPNLQNDGRHALYFDGPEIEIRSAEQGAPVRVFGYSALFNVRSQEMRTNRGKRFVEIILPGAFDNANFRTVNVGTIITCLSRAAIVAVWMKRAGGLSTTMTLTTRIMCRCWRKIRRGEVRVRPSCLMNRM